VLFYFLFFSDFIAVPTKNDKPPNSNAEPTTSIMIELNSINFTTPYSSTLRTFSSGHGFLLSINPTRNIPIATAHPNTTSDAVGYPP
jgi:hypothetical protein